MTEAPRTITLAQRVKDLEADHGGLRAAARAVGVDPAYLKRLRDGEKANPSDETLKKLHLEKGVVYVVQR